MVQQEKKSVFFMTEIVHKFSKPGELTLDAFAGIFYTTKACLLIKKHKRLFGCHKDVDYLQKYVPSFALWWKFGLCTCLQKLTKE